MTKSLSALTFAVALVMSAPPAAVAQDNDAFARGVAAYEAGNYETAADFWAPLAEDGVPEAQRNLAQLYRLGLGVERNNKRAYDLYIAAAEQNSVEAQVNVAFLLLTGEGVEKNSKQAALWFAKAADQGDALAQFNLGLMYEKGVGVPQNRETARELYQLAANQGQERALARLDAIESDLPPDGGEASRREREEARRQEAARAEAAERERKRQEQDVARVRERAQTEAEEEERSAMEKAEAEAKTGPILMMEKVVDKEPELPQLLTASDRSEETPSAAVKAVENAEAAFNDAPLAAPAARQKPKPPTTKKPQVARAFTPAPAPSRSRAPQAGQTSNAEAAYRRGDFNTAVGLLIPLSQQGDPAAQFLLGRMYNRGEGVAVDHFQAYSLWRGASDSGNQRAATALANFSARYLPEDLARAEQFYQEQKRLGVIRTR